jgi:hypothetical protein
VLSEDDGCELCWMFIGVDDTSDGGLIVCEDDDVIGLRMLPVPFHCSSCRACDCEHLCVEIICSAA